ncbi:MAG: dipeptidyl peptidase 3 [Schleiferiaceae bacterium]|nr:dipeptidyl peptidase 3 [Schleiferiaceae bacterium]
MHTPKNTIVVDRFDDVQILRYDVPGFDKLSLSQKCLVYHLSEAGYFGRDIFWDQNFRHNLVVRNFLELIYTQANATYKTSLQWEAFEVYLKKVWFSNGIHHHYGQQKLQPKFTEIWLADIAKSIGVAIPDTVRMSLFDPAFASKKVVKDPSSDMVLQSAVNFYEPDITQAEVENFYDLKAKHISKETPISIGLNSQIVRNVDGSLGEAVYKLGGKYGVALEKIVHHLKAAVGFAENRKQAQALQLLIKYYETGDLAIYDEFSIAWLATTEGVVDFIHGFTEVYEDPMGYKGTFEAIIQLRDAEATKRMGVMLDNINWFEANSPIPEAYKKEEVRGISYSIMNVVAEAGDASPATPIGVNLPNADWIRSKYGSKSVSLINIENAYDKASGIGLTAEFTNDLETLERAEKHGAEASKMHTALHEVVGHGSGKLKAGVATPKETLKNYSNTIEEARADLVALYFMLDEQLVKWGILSSVEVGKAAYDQFMRNGLQLQLRRLQLGDNLEEDHMRNRQLIAKWVFERAMPIGVMSMAQVDGKSYYKIHDYNALQNLFGQLLNEIQRIKSEGDYQAARELVEAYAVNVDVELHKEVLARVEALHLPPYSGFVNPYLIPVYEGDTCVDVRLEYPESFVAQMMRYSNRYITLAKSIKE